MNEVNNSNSENRLNSTPSTDISNKVAKAKEMLNKGKDQGVLLMKKYPKRSAAIGAALVVLSWIGYSYQSKPNIPMVNAYTGTTPNKLQVTGNTQDGQFIVLSSLKKNDKLFLNNHRDYKQATQTVVVDLKACPDLSGIDAKALLNKTVKFKGFSATYDSKPQVIVNSSNDISFNGLSTNLGK